MSLLQPPDAFEQLALDAVLNRPPTVEGGRSFWRIKRFTWGEGPDPNTRKWSAGQRYAVDVVLELSDTGTERIPGAVVSVLPLVCIDAHADAFNDKKHRHDDAACRYRNEPDTPVHRAWQFAAVAEAVLAAMRWEPEQEVEPFGWQRALDGTRRVRPGGDPARETVGS